MSLEFIAKKSIGLPVPAAEVWKALTSPDLIRKYFFGTEAVSKWKVGSSIVFRGTWEGKPYEDKGTILALEKNRFLRYNYWSSFSGTVDTPSNYSNITYTLVTEKDNPEHTILTITQDNCASAEARDHSASNWGIVLDNLRKVLVRES